MKHYIGTKLIQAEPMSLEEAQKVLGREIKPAVDEADGYLVEYDNGYKSWSPKTVFEKAYRLAESDLDKMKNEFDNNFDKFQATKTLLIFRQVMSHISVALLLAQVKTQEEYGRLLANRIDVAEGNPPGLAGFSFGVAIKLLEEGCALRRKAWKLNGKGFICKQMRCTEEGETIECITSLPKQAKKLLMQQDNPHISFENQLLIVKSNGAADSWAPSPSDIFANDWEVVLPE